MDVIIQKRIKKALIIFLVLLEIFAAGFICFYKLNVINIADWDEARHGINAYEMIKTKNYIVNTYCYEADYWNLKPPFSYWFIILCYKLFGYNMVGFRAYSGISFLAMFILIILFMQKKFGIISALISGLFILSLDILLLYHLPRYGDADSLYCLFYIGAFVSLLYSNKNKKMFVVSGLCFSLAFLTKSYHAATIVISTVVYLLVDKKYKMYSKYDFVKYLFAAFVPIIIWMIARFTQDGLNFFIESFRVDVLNRSTTVIENHQGSFFYYFINVLDVFKELLFITFISFILRIVYKQSINVDNTIKALFIWIIIPIILFSVVKTKLPWYIYPEYFIICMFLAAVFAKAFEINKKIILAVSVVLLLLPMYYVYNNIDKVSHWDQYKSKSQYLISNNICRTEEYVGKKFYDLNERQSICLLVELYGDMIYVNGSIDEFANEPTSAYLFISKSDYEQNSVKLKNLTVVDENEINILLKKD